MSFPRYNNYRDSGLAWLGKVPTHWSIAPIKAHFRVVGGSTPKSDVEEFWDGEIPWVTPVDLDDNGIKDFISSRRSITPEGLASCGTTLVPPGSIVLSTRAPIGSLGIARVTACTNQGCKSLVPKGGLISRLLAYFLSIATSELRIRGKGTTFLELASDELGTFRVAIPPPSEQTGIVAFLDRETGKIDRLVEEQKRLIDLLKEKRQAVISHAVTKGLNPDAQMKASGVDWLGEVPAHWVGPIKLNDMAANTRHSFVNGPFGSDLLTEELVPDGVPVIYIRDLKSTGYRRVSEWCVTHGKAKDLRFCDVIPGDILVAKVGDPPGLAVVYPNEEPAAIVTQDVIRLRPDEDRIVPDFLAFLLNSEFGRTLIDSISVESTRTRIGLGEYKQLRFVIPPPSEQGVIVTHLNGKVAGIDALIAEAELGITLLQERRAALISATVTGKIDLGDIGFSTQVDKSRLRLILAATITEATAHKSSSGRTKAHKITYLAEAHAGIHELQGSYIRKAAGPLDWNMITETEAQLQSSGHVTVEQPDGHGTLVTYKVVGQRGAFRDDLQDALGSRTEALNRLIGTLADLETKSVEAIATLYAVWNDALIDGTHPTDRDIVAGVLNDWHPDKKKKFTASELQTWLDWMRRHQLVPNGQGPRTQLDRLFA